MIQKSKTPRTVATVHKGQTNGRWQFYFNSFAYFLGKVFDVLPYLLIAVSIAIALGAA